MPKIAAIIQARFFSRRLPAKIIKELPWGSGIPVLAQVIRRLKRSKRLNDIIVATTKDKTNVKIIGIAKKEKVKWFMGSEKNVLNRYFLAATQNKVDIIVRVTSDCPCVDANIVDSIIERHLDFQADFTATPIVNSYPSGLGVEVFNFNALRIANSKATRKFEKEHVTPYIYKHPEKFKVIRADLDRRLRAADVRVTLDTQEDYCLLCAVFDYFYPKRADFTAFELVNLFKEKPWLKLINKKIIQKKIFTTLRDELKEAVRLMDLQDLKGARDLIKKYLSR